MARDAYKEPWQVAALIAEMMKRSNRTRGRLSDVALKQISGRRKLETSIRTQIFLDSLDYGYLLHRLDKGNGTVVVSLSALVAAKPFARGEIFDDAEWAAIKDGSFDFAGLHDSLLESDDDAAG